MQMVQQWTDGTIGNPSNPPNDQPTGGTGGAEKDWFAMATADELRAIVREEVGNRLKDLDSVIRQTYNLADWTNSRTSGLEPSIQQTYNLVDWTNDRTKVILDKIVGEAPKA